MSTPSKFQRSLYEIAVECGGEISRVEVEGFSTTHPDFAITQHLYSGKFYAVSHLPTGMRLTGTYSSLPRLRKFAAVIAALNINWHEALHNNQTDTRVYIALRVGVRMEHWLFDINHPTQEERVAPWQNIM